MNPPIPQYNTDCTHFKGNLAENIAVKYLTAKGYEILKRNFHFGKVGEIDIIAQDKAIIVFVEVRSRTTNSYGSPLESMTWQKQNKLRQVAKGWLYVNKITEMDCRFDFISVDMRGDDPVIEHLENVM